MEQCNTLLFKNQIVYCGFDVHKNSWKVHLRYCNLDLAPISMHPNQRYRVTDKDVELLNKNTGGAQ